MTIVFVSNYINHHQIPFCEALRIRAEAAGGSFVFIQTEPMEEERLQMGWADVSASLPWVHFLDREEEVCRELILGADVLLQGWSPRADTLVQERLEGGKLSFLISERIYKEGQWKALSPRGLMAKHHAYTRHRRAPYWLLTAGGYVASDFSLIHAFPGKMLRFGYFPACRTYPDPQALIARKTPRTILWAGRFVDFKHPELLPVITGRLKDAGETFALHVAGGGQGEEKIRRQVQERGLEENVVFHGFLSPEEVRGLMESCQILLMTSDAGEGWGAVLNEGMNSGMAVLAGTEAGAAPVLIREGENGLLYTQMELEEMIAALQRLLRDLDLCQRLGTEAYRTIRDTWNAGEAADRLYAFCQQLVEREGEEATGQWQGIELPAEGPLSRDPVLKPYVRAGGRRG